MHTIQLLNVSDAYRQQSIKISYMTPHRLIKLQNLFSQHHCCSYIATKTTSTSSPLMSKLQTSLRTFYTFHCFQHCPSYTSRVLELHGYKYYQQSDWKFHKLKHRYVKQVNGRSSNYCNTYARQYAMYFFKVFSCSSPGRASSDICNAFMWMLITCFAKVCNKHHLKFNSIHFALYIYKQYTPCFIKNWTICYFIVYLLWQLRTAWKFPEIHRRCCLLWIWNKCLWLISYSLLIAL